MMPLYPIAFNYSPLSFGRHCRIEDLDKVDSLARSLDYEDRFRAAKIGPWSRMGLQALALVASCFRGQSNKRYAFITERILRRHRITFEEVLPALQLMEESGMIQLKYHDNGTWVVYNQVKPLSGPLAESFMTKVVTEDLRASRIPSGTIAAVKTMIVFGNHESRQFGEYAHFANTKPESDDIYITVDFVIANGEFAGQFISHDYKIGTKQSGPVFDCDIQAFREIANSALNLFPWDNSEEAEFLRESLSADVEGPFWNLQEHYLVIETGKQDGDGGKNSLLRIIQPDHPKYIEVMGLGKGVEAGTGVLGEHVPPTMPAEFLSGNGNQTIAATSGDKNEI